jgi:hypothetical protein
MDTHAYRAVNGSICSIQNCAPKVKSGMLPMDGESKHS